MRTRMFRTSFHPSIALHPRLAAALVCALALLSSGASCSGTRGNETTGGGRETARGDRAQAESAGGSGSRIERLDAVDLGELTASERRLWVDLVNDLLSPCGEPSSVARCAQRGGSCRRCVAATRYVARLIAEGYERTEIEELYDLRYGRDTAVEVTTDGMPTRGALMAPVTIVEFSDFECPYCGRAHPILSQLLRDFEGEVRVVFRHYPLSGHLRAVPAARAAHAAGEQGKFWEMADLLFEHQRQLEDEDFERYAQQLGLDLERFRADMRSPATQAAIDRDREEGRRLDVQGTPTFFVNGRRFQEPPTSLPAYVREELDQ